MFEPRFTTHGFRYVRVEGHPGPLDRRRRHRGRRAHRPGAPRLLRLRRRPHQPAARRRGVELPRQRLRHPDRLPDPRARRLDGRLAALRADRDVPLRRRRLLREVAARPRGEQWEDGTLGSMAPMPVAERTGFLREDQRLRGLGRRRRPGAVGALRRSTATSRCSRSSGRRWCAGSTASSGWRTSTRHPDRVARSAEPPAARAVPLGHRLPLGRVARARRRAAGLRGVHRRRQVRRGDGLLRLVDRGTPPRIAALLGKATRTPTRYAALSAAVVDAWRTRVRRRRRPRHAAHPGQPGPRAALRARARRACASGPPTTSPTWSARPTPTSAPASSRRPTCCRCWPTTATSTWPTSCCSRTPSRRGWR